jgi:hypothetical protein
MNEHACQGCPHSIEIEVTDDDMGTIDYANFLLEALEMIRSGIPHHLTPIEQILIRHVWRAALEIERKVQAKARENQKR